MFFEGNHFTCKPRQYLSCCRGISSGDLWVAGLPCKCTSGVPPSCIARPRSTGSVHLVWRILWFKKIPFAIDCSRIIPYQWAPTNYIVHSFKEIRIESVLFQWKSETFFAIIFSNFIIVQILWESHSVSTELLQNVLII